MIIFYFIENSINYHHQLHRKQIIPFIPQRFLQNTLGFNLATKKKEYSLVLTRKSHQEEREADTEKK